MWRRTGKMAVFAVACAALSAPAEARPRFLRVIGILAAGSVAAIAGATHAGARYRTHVPRRDTADLRLEKRGPATGWAGPLFWPHASNDLFDYVFGQHGGADRFWSYGYGDILDGMFVTASVSSERSQGRRIATRVAENSSGSSQKTAPNWQSMCGAPASQMDAIVERIRTRLVPTPEQSEALDAIRHSLVKANATLEKSCPDTYVTAATERMDVMASRLMAMRHAASTVLPPLRKFYAMLDDNQKAIFNEVDTDREIPSGAPIRTSSVSGGCAESMADGNWPTGRIARRVAPKGHQFAELERLRQTSASFEKFVMTSCNADKAKTPPERLEAARNRVNVLRYTVTRVSPALDQFYGSLNARQQARFSSLGR